MGPSLSSKLERVSKRPVLPLSIAFDGEEGAHAEGVGG
jgi:hypothetical protein